MFKNRPRIRFLILGALFGICFPIVATLIEMARLPVSFSLASAIELHLNNPLLLIIDTAPFFLALFSYGIGIATEKLTQAQAVREADNVRHIALLETRNEELDKLNKVMDGLVYTASHDLKAPLNNLRSMTTMLRDVLKKPGSEMMAEKIMDKMDHAGTKMSNTITDLLDVSRMEAEFKEKWEKIGLAALVNDVVEDQEQMVVSKSARVLVEIPDSFQVEFSRQSLESLFGNLISNALKYSSEDRAPEIHVSARALAEGIEIKVRDNGRGIDLATHGENLFKIFKRFHTGVEGSGVGLYIVKRIVQKAGGSIGVDSTVDVGTTFTLTFPVSVSPEA